MVMSNPNLNDIMKIPFNTPLALLGFVFLLISSASAQVLTREVAAKLIAEYEQIRLKEVAVGPMLKVEKRSKNGVITTGGIQVKYIATKVVNSLRRRTACEMIFHHDAEWGWYAYFQEQLSGRDRFYVISEKEGNFEVR